MCSFQILKLLRQIGIVNERYWGTAQWNTKFTVSYASGPEWQMKLFIN